MSETAAYAVFETSSGAQIHRIPLQAFPKFWAYVYVIRKDGVLNRMLPMLPRRDGK